MKNGPNRRRDVCRPGAALAVPAPRTARADGSIRIPLTQRDLAFLIGASREAVAEQLAGLKLKGLIKTSYRAISLTDREGLKKFFARQSAGKARTADEL